MFRNLCCNNTELETPLPIILVGGAQARIMRDSLVPMHMQYTLGNTNAQVDWEEGAEALDSKSHFIRSRVLI